MQSGSSWQCSQEEREHREESQAFESSSRVGSSRGEASVWQELLGNLTGTSCSGGQEEEFSLRRDEAAGAEVEGAAGPDLDPMEMEGLEYTLESRGAVLRGDLLRKVFGFFDMTDLCRAAMVCRHWKEVSSDPLFWQELNFEGREVTSEFVLKLCSRYPGVTCVNLRGCRNLNEADVISAIGVFWSLKKLVLGSHFLTTFFISRLQERCPDLEDFSLSNAMLLQRGLNTALSHQRLRSCQLIRCNVLHLSLNCPVLESLSLHATSADELQLSCPMLSSLDLSSCQKLTDSGIRAAVTSCTALTSLNLEHCSALTDETLRVIGGMCERLVSLDVSHCPNIALDSTRFPCLAHLRLACCEGVVLESMRSVGRCHLLRSLVLDWCCLLPAVTLELPLLETLSVANCKKLRLLHIGGRSLMEVCVDGCSSLRDFKLESRSLASLMLREQISLRSVSLSCQLLREVDLSACDALTDQALSCFSDGRGCPSVSVLRLDYCEGLVEIRLHSSCLRTLSLVGCCNVKHLDLSCPLLDELNLDACDQLAHVSLSPVNLETLNLGICPQLAFLKVAAPSLTSIELRGCGALERTVLSCPRLRSLDASYCSQLSDSCLSAAAAACSSIQKLVLAACPTVGPVGLRSLSQFANLTSLDLSYTFLSDLQPVFEACPRLAVLKLSACKTLQQEAFEPMCRATSRALPQLRELDISYGSLSAEALERLLLRCPHLEHISLNGCQQIRDTLWEKVSAPPLLLAAAEGEGDDGQEGHASQDAAMTVFPRNSSDDPFIPDDPPTSLLCEDNKAGSTPTAPPSSPTSPRRLLSLSCVGCSSLRAVTIPPKAACSELAYLNLTWAASLTVVSLSCPNLSNLILNNCSSLNAINLDCPRLSTLSLGGSSVDGNMLVELVQNCPMLETLDVRSCPQVSRDDLSKLRLTAPWLRRMYNSLSG